MRYDELVTLSWREDVGDDFETAEVWAEVVDSGTASFDVGSGLTRSDAYSVTMRYHSMPPAMRTLLYNVTQRAVPGRLLAGPRPSAGAGSTRYVHRRERPEKARAHDHLHVETTLE